MISASAPSLDEIRQERARRSFQLFKRHVWWMPQPLLEGIHSRAVAQRLTQAVRDYKRGVSTFLCIRQPFRHGKSDDVSRAFPAWCLGELADHEPDIILASYGFDLSETFSRKVQDILGSEEYRALYPGIKLDKSHEAMRRWGVQGSTGEVVATGLRGAVTGRGGHVIVVDDFFKNREEAESETIRARVWNGLSNDILTRRAPVCIVIICATPWHVDDPFGRIQREMADNPDFPRFEFMTFPAQSEDYPGGYLFPERFPQSWYDGQRATLGKYAAAGLLDCDPQPRSGNIFQTENVRFYNSTADWPKGLRFRRGWDLASTEKQRTSDDPDYTAGVLAACSFDEANALHLWIKDAVSCRQEAPARDRLILDTHERDGTAIEIRVEGVAGYKDAYTTLKNRLRGKAVVRRVGAVTDKVAKLGFLEAPFEAGNVHILKGAWNDAFLSHFTTFPKGHDDFCDATYAAIEDYSKHISVIFDRATMGF